MKKIRHLSEVTMLRLAEDLMTQSQGRRVLEAHPRLRPFIESFEDVIAVLREAVPSEDLTRERDIRQVRRAKDGVEVHHDGVLRQKLFCLAGGALGWGEAVPRGLARLRTLLMPGGRKTLRLSSERKVRAAYAADDRLTSGDLVLMQRIRAPQGTLLGLHEARLRLAGALLSYESTLARLRGQGPPARRGRKAKSAWIQLIRQLEREVEEIGLGEGLRGQLIGPVETAAAEALVRRRKRDGLAPARTMAGPANGEAGRRDNEGETGALRPVWGRTRVAIELGRVANSERAEEEAL